MMGCSAFSYLFSINLVILLFCPILATPSFVAIASGIGMYCLFATLIGYPVFSTSLFSCEGIAEWFVDLVLVGLHD